MDAKQVVRILKNDGWYFDSQRGSHRYYKHPTKKGKVPVPFHGRKDIPVGTLTNILKQDGLEKMHFRKD